MNDGKIKITVEGYGKKNTIEVPDDTDTVELLEAMISQLKYLTFPYPSILIALKTEVEKLENLFEFLSEQ